MTEGLEPAFSKLQVFDAKGTEVGKKDTKVNGSTMKVSLPKLAAKIPSFLAGCRSRYPKNVW
jgi:hypothetical protein